MTPEWEKVYSQRKIWWNDDDSPEWRTTRPSTNKWIRRQKDTDELSSATKTISCCFLPPFFLFCNFLRAFLFRLFTLLFVSRLPPPAVFREIRLCYSPSTRLTLLHRNISDFPALELRGEDVRQGNVTRRWSNFNSCVALPSFSWQRATNINSFAGYKEVKSTPRKYTLEAYSSHHQGAQKKLPRRRKDLSEKGSIDCAGEVRAKKRMVKNYTPKRN